MIDENFDRKSTTANVLLYLIEWMKVEKGMYENALKSYATTYFESFF